MSRDPRSGPITSYTVLRFGGFESQCPNESKVNFLITIVRFTAFVHNGNSALFTSAHAIRQENYFFTVYLTLEFLNSHRLVYDFVSDPQLQQGEQPKSRTTKVKATNYVA